MTPVKWNGLKDPDNDLFTKRRKHGVWDLVQSEAFKRPMTKPPTKEGWVLYCPTTVPDALVLEHGSRPRLVLGEMSRDEARKLAEAIITKAEGTVATKSKKPAKSGLAEGSDPLTGSTPWERGEETRVQGSGPVPPAVLAARAAILAEHGGGGDCTRCGGEGYLEDNETWIVAEGKKGVGKVCFRCQGDGIDPGDGLPDPLIVRANVVAKLVPLVEAGNVVGLAKLARQFGSGPFWPVLEDAFQRAEKAAKARRSVKVASTVTTRLRAPQRASRSVREVSTREHLSRGLNGYFADVLEKHHPGASAEEFADAMGGHTTFGGEVFFYEEDEEF